MVPFQFKSLNTHLTKRPTALFFTN